MSRDNPVIAVVDDDVSVCTGVQRLLRSAGLTATTFTSGADFLTSLETRKPDCVVLDIRMPVMTGFDVQARIRKMGLMSLPVIFISADERLDGRNEAMASGGFAFLQKPFDGQLLVDTIASAMASLRR